MSEMNKTIDFGYIGLMLFGVGISSFSQVLLKKAANRRYANKMKEYLNIRVITAYLLFFLASICTILAYREVPLSMGPILESSSYVFVTIFSFIFFNERIGKSKLTGLFLIVLGILVFSIV